MKQRAGFTLVEVTIVMAIIAMLIPLAWMGQREVRARVQMLSSLDRVKNTLVAVRTEAATTASIKGDGITSGSPACTGTSRLAIGKLVEFTSGSNDMAISNLMTDSDFSLVAVCDTTHSTIPWSGVFTLPSGASLTRVAFVRSFTNGALGAYVFGAAVDLTRTSNYNVSNRITGVFNFTDNQNHTGTITVDAVTMSITRKGD